MSQPKPPYINDNNNDDNNGSKSSSSFSSTSSSNSNSSNSNSPPRKETLNKKLIAYRRDQVLSMSSQGVRQVDIAKALHVTQASVSLDLQYLRMKAKQALGNYLESRFPMYFEETLLGVNDVIKESWDLYHNPSINVSDKVHILHLINSANELKLDMCSNGGVIEEAVRFAQNAKNQLIQIAPDKANQILHDDNQEVVEGGEEQQEEVHNGHTRKFINRSIRMRRSTVHSLMAKGLNQYEVAARVNCSPETVSKDVAWLRNYYKQQMLHYIEDRLPELWESCLTQVHSTMAAVSAIIEDPATSTHDKIHAHSLMLNCIEVKEELISDPTIIQEALQVVNETKKRIVELNPSAAAGVHSVGEVDSKY